MTGFFELFNPGQRHAREQKDFDKVAVVPTRKGGRGPLQIDLDGGTVRLPGSHPHLSDVAVSGAGLDDATQSQTTQSRTTQSQTTQSETTSEVAATQGESQSSTISIRIN